MRAELVLKAVEGLDQWRPWEKSHGEPSWAGERHEQRNVLVLGGRAELMHGEGQSS